MLQDIHKSGITDREIALRLSTPDDQVSQSIVTRWRNSVIQTTDYNRYIRIKDLHFSLFGETGKHEQKNGSEMAL